MVRDERENRDKFKKNRFVNKNYRLFAGIMWDNLTITLHRKFTTSRHLHVEINEVNFNDFETFDSVLKL